MKTIRNNPKVIADAFRIDFFIGFILFVPPTLLGGLFLISASNCDTKYIDHKIFV